jgi:23S rRNA (adenine-N6)-dimethyltransferase
MSSSLHPGIGYSQNFLQDPRLVASLLDTYCLDREGTVYEIGPGKGIITEQLARRYQQVVAIEKDPYLTTLLRRRFAQTPNVTIHGGDFLRYHLPSTRYQVIASIPFNITSAIVARLTAARPPEVAHLVMQREAAETLMGQPHESLRTLYLKPWFEMDIVHRFRRTDFRPVPHVDSVMLRLRKRGPPLVRPGDRQAFRDFVAYVFTAWEPTVQKSLGRLYTRRQLDRVRATSNFNLEVIPTALTLEQWLQLFTMVRPMASERSRAAIVGSEKRLAQQQKRLEKIHRTRTRR